MISKMIIILMKKNNENKGNENNDKEKNDEDIKKMIWVKKFLFLKIIFKYFKLEKDITIDDSILLFEGLKWNLICLISLLNEGLKYIA